MLTAVRLGSYVGVLGVVFGVAWGAGNLIGPELGPASPSAATGMTTMVGGAPVVSSTDGLAQTAGGYTLVPRTTTFAADRPGELAVTVVGRGGRPVTSFDTPPGGAPMRLMVVRRDGADFRSIVPTAAPDGTWTTPLQLPSAGAWRLLAEFSPAGSPRVVLGTDLFVPGDFTPRQFPVSRSTQAGGYTVRLDGDLLPGATASVFATVSRDGQGITDLEPIDGVFGQVVALRVGDLAYTPVEAETRALPDERSGPGIALRVTIPTDGVYRLFLTFRHEGELRSVDFTVLTAGLPAAARAGGYR